MKNSVAIVAAAFLSLVVFTTALTIAKREYAKALLENIEATALWKESDSISSAMANSFAIAKLNNGDKTAALQALCGSLRQDLKSLEDLAEISQLNNRRASALSKARTTYNQWCVEPHA